MAQQFNLKTASVVSAAATMASTGLHPAVTQGAQIDTIRNPILFLNEFFIFDFVLFRDRLQTRIRTSFFGSDFRPGLSTPEEPVPM
ncbi:MAG: hypothetical protein ABI164_07690 [Acidobacteriaceae bacterium]